MEVIQDQFRHFYATASDSVDAALQDHRPHQIVLLVTSSVLLFCYAYGTLFNKYCIFPLRHRLTHKAVRWSLRLPFIGSIIKKELDAARADMRTAVQFKQGSLGVIVSARQCLIEIRPHKSCTFHVTIIYGRYNLVVKIIWSARDRALDNVGS